MIPLSGEEAGGALGVAPLPFVVPGVSTDTRTIRRGELFVALRGENFDGHDFVAAAFAAGASGAVVEAEIWAEKRASQEERLPLGGDSPIYAVDDSLEGLGALARAVRRKSDVVVIAVTGSVGKTTTKDLLQAMAGGICPTVATRANENNEVGVPRTLLRIESSDQIAVVEMGMRGRGQIAALAGVAEPDVGLVTNIHQVHLEALGSIESIAEAKAELFRGLTTDGVAVIPADCELLAPHAKAAGRRVVRFGMGAGAGGAEIRGSFKPGASGADGVLLVRWPDGEVDAEMPFASRHRLEDTVAAAAACYAAGLPLDRCLQGVGRVSFSGSRGDVTDLGGLCLINDTYNASPAAVRASLDDLVEVARQLGGRAVAVLGDMLELGPEAERYHREAGVYAAEVGVQALWGVGPLSEATVEGYRKACEGRSGARDSGVVAGPLSSAEEVGPLLMGLRSGDVVLFKASRNMKLESAVARVVAEAEAGAWGGSSASEGVDGPTRIARGDRGTSAVGDPIRRRRR